MSGSNNIHAKLVKIQGNSKDNPIGMAVVKWCAVRVGAPNSDAKADHVRANLQSYCDGLFHRRAPHSLLSYWLDW